jgi:hypothetical protein
MVEYTIEYAEKALMSLTEDDRHWISEQLERVETRLLTEFHGWASPFEAAVYKNRSLTVGKPG